MARFDCSCYFLLSKSHSDFTLRWLAPLFWRKCVLTWPTAPWRIWCCDCARLYACDIAGWRHTWDGVDKSQAVLTLHLCILGLRLSPCRSNCLPCGVISSSSCGKVCYNYLHCHHTKRNGEGRNTGCGNCRPFWGPAPMTWATNLQNCSNNWPAWCISF